MNRRVFRSLLALIVLTALSPLALAREVGVVKWFNEAKGYGFIVRDEGTDVFVNRAGFMEGVCRIAEGERVEFDVVKTSKGPQASNVVPVSGSGCTTTASKSSLPQVRSSAPASTAEEDEIDTQEEESESESDEESEEDEDAGSDEDDSEDEDSWGDEKEEEDAA